MRTAPTIRCFPSADRTFAREVAELAARITGDEPLAPATLETELRRRYPEAAIRPQDPFASLDGVPTWYVYRRRPMGPDPVAVAGAVSEGSEGSPSNEAATPTDAPARYGDVPVYAPAVVARMVGVPLAVLVGWDERDHLVRPTTADGRRLYSRKQVEELRRLKQEIAAGRDPVELQGVLDAQRAQPRGADAAPSVRNVVVLVAERDPFAAEFVEYLLTTEGYQVTVAYGTQEAEAALSESPPDVAIVETLLPDGRGLELCARLAAADVPVIAVASVDGEGIALDAGASAFLPKPLQPLRLLSAVRDLLGDSAFARGGR